MLALWLCLQPVIALYSLRTYIVQDAVCGGQGSIIVAAGEVKACFPGSSKGGCTASIRARHMTEMHYAGSCNLQPTTAHSARDQPGCREAMYLKSQLPDP